MDLRELIQDPKTELRQDPVTGDYVTIAEERGNRPNSTSLVFEQKILPPSDADCPFCPGNENRTPPEKKAYRNGQFWWLRGVENKFPAFVLSNGSSLTDKIAESEAKRFFRTKHSEGIHEVIIETPLHNERISDRSVSQVRELLWFYKERLEELKSQGAASVLIFKNNGDEAGQSLEHPHSQIVVPPVPFPVLMEEIAGVSRYFLTPNYRGMADQCVYCDMVNLELKNKYGTDSGKNRIIAENQFYVAFAPFASRFPFQLMILPRIHQTHYSYIGPEEATELAEITKEVFKKLERTIPNGVYNMALHTAPLHTDTVYYHWHFEIAPRLVKIGGLDLLGGIYINQVAPERAAHILNSNHQP